MNAAPGNIIETYNYRSDVIRSDRVNEEKNLALASNLCDEIVDLLLKHLKAYHDVRSKIDKEIEERLEQLRGVIQMPSQQS